MHVVPLSPLHSPISAPSLSLPTSPPYPYFSPFYTPISAPSITLLQPPSIPLLQPPPYPTSAPSIPLFQPPPYPLSSYHLPPPLPSSYSPQFLSFLSILIFSAPNPHSETMFTIDPFRTKFISSARGASWLKLFQANCLAVHN